jgi:CRISPR/Cas system-associated endonuclease Cas1
MTDQRVYLKVKAKTLAAEARIIRHEERRNPKRRAGLAEHRRTVVREEARATHLAYGLIRGRTLEQMERNARTAPKWDRVNRMLRRYGGPKWHNGFSPD